MLRIIFSDTSRYAWACVLTQTVEHEIADKNFKMQPSIIYQSDF